MSSHDVSNAVTACTCHEWMDSHHSTIINTLGTTPQNTVQSASKCQSTFTVFSNAFPSCISCDNLDCLALLASPMAISRSMSIIAEMLMV